MAKSTLLALLAAVVCFHIPSASAQVTSIGYQGQLYDGGKVANGNYDLTFTFYQLGTGGSPLFGPVTNLNVAVGNGLFTTYINVTGINPLLFNSSSLTAAHFLETGARSNGVAVSFTALTPRQPIANAPASVFAGTAGLANSVAANSVIAADIAPSQVVKNLNGLEDSVIFAAGANLTLSTNGNTLTLAGSGNGSGGSSNNSWTLTGNAGTAPGSNYVGTSDSQPLELRVNAARVLRLEPGGGGSPNIIGGSANNSASGAVGATIAGGGVPGNINSVTASYGAIGGGQGNTVSGGVGNTVAGGFNNLASGGNATVGGGYGNGASGGWALVAGGVNNNATADDSAVAGGRANTAGAPGAFVGGGGYDGASIGGNRAQGGASVVSGGFANMATANYASVSGGQSNSASGLWSAVSGGRSNVASGIGASVSGGGFDGTTVAGNFAGGNASFVGGGIANKATNYYATVGGGGINAAFGQSTTVAGGYGNTALGASAVVGGGAYNVAGGDQANVAGGSGNHATASYATVGGGENNNATGARSTVPGGSGNTASGGSSFAAGLQAQATDDNTFVWSDGSSDGAFNSTSSNQFLIHASGGVGIGTNAPAAALDIASTAPTNVALRISSGAIAVSGAGVGTSTSAFIHLANSTNMHVSGALGSCPTGTIIDNPLCNDDPNAMLFVTTNFTPDGSLTNSVNGGVYGVQFLSAFQFGCTCGKWAIVNLNTSYNYQCLASNSAFNVLVIKQ